MKLYKVDWNASIKEVESERQTDKSVFVNGNRYAWKSDSSSFYETYLEAKNHIVEHITSKINKNKSQYEYLSAQLSKAEQL